MMDSGYRSQINLFFSNIDGSQTHAALGYIKEWLPHHLARNPSLIIDITN